MPARKLYLVLVFTAFLGLCGCSSPDMGWHTVDSHDKPAWLVAKPPHYEFSALRTNADPLTTHPAAGDGQDWEPAAWNANWTPDVAVKNFFAANIFKRIYLQDKVLPVVVVGPTFYKLSGIDQRRTLKLLVDQAGIFQQGHDTVKLVDWYNHFSIGIYTPKGMFLN